MASAFRSAAEKIGGFEFVGYCECDPTAIAAYRTLYHTEGEYFCNDARAINTDELPDFDLLVGGFPCQDFSQSGRRLGFNSSRGTLFFELARLLEAKKPAYFLFENVSAILSFDHYKVFETILNEISKLGVLTGEIISPRAESECSLRDILIPDVPDRYFLSAKKSLRLLPNSQVTELRENGSTTPEEVP